jgi:PAS domain S-box-containing protein
MGSDDHAPNHHEQPVAPERPRALADVAPDLLLVLRLPSGQICDANQTACQRLGIERASLLESMAAKWIKTVSGQLESVLEHMAKDPEGAATLTADLVAGDGRRFPAELLIKATLFEGEHVAVVAARDMTDRYVVRQALLESEAQYRALVETSSDWIWEVDSNGVYTYASPKVKELLGFQPEEVVGKTPFDFMRPDEASRLKEEFGALLAHPQAFSTWENVNLHKDGYEVVLETSGVPIIDAHGKLHGYRGVDRDISERQEAEEALQRSATVARGLLDGTPESLLLVNQDATILAINEAGARRFNASPEDLVETNAYDLFPPDLRESRRQHIEEAMRTGVPVLFEDTREGMRFETHVQPVSDKKGEIVGLAIFSRDITQRRQMEETLRQSEARMRSVFRAAPTGIGVVSDRVLVQVNERICQMTGYPVEELIGRKSRILYVNDEDFEYVGREKYRQIHESGTGTVETRWRRKDGSVIDVLLSSTPIDPGDFSIGVTFSALDISDRKRAEEALEKRLVALTRPLETDESIDFDDLFNLPDIQEIQDLFAEAAGVASIITRPDGTPITKSSNFCRLCNDVIRATSKGLQNCYCSDAIIGRHNPHGPTVQTCLSGGLWDAGASITAGGRHVANWLIGQVRNDTQDEESARQYALEIGADVETYLTAFREVPTMSRERFGRIAEALFVLANQLSKLAFQNIQQARFITDRKRAEESLVQEKAFSESVIDSLPGIFYLFDQDGRLRRWNDNFERVSGYTPEELPTMKPWDFFAGNDKQYIAEQTKVVFESGLVSATADFVSKDGRATPYIFTGVRVTLNHAPFMAGMGMDITDRKQAEAEREELIAELEARNTELERFTYTVSHDLKSPLITIKGYVGMLAEDLREGNAENVEDDIQRIAKSADTMADLLKELLELSRIGRIVNPSTEFSLDELAREAVAAVGGPISQRGVQVHIGEDLPIAYGDRHRLLEVFQNLVENAVKYMGNQEHPVIQIDAEPAEGMILAYVQDNGIGIEAQYCERIFGLFDQLDAGSDGTGIGLALVKRIVETHGGRIWVESEGAGTGSRFCFTIPVPPSPTS